ncbi:MAG: hypothetical protein WB812_08480 [Woeseiaceae bacterium]
MSDMNGKHAIALLAAALPGLALAQGADSYQCTLGDLTRRVEILTEPGRSVPCEVHYYKDTEAPGEMQVLWRAQSEAGYCQRKADDFVARLEGMGWDCGAGTTAEPSEPAESAEPMAPNAAPEPETSPPPAETPPAEPSDDTDVLAPADQSG